MSVEFYYAELWFPDSVRLLVKEKNLFRGAARVLGACLPAHGLFMEFVPELGGWVRQQGSAASADYAQNRNVQTRAGALGHSPSNYPPHVDRWRNHALRATSQNLAFGTVSADGGGASMGTGGPEGWSPATADGILFTASSSVSQAEPDHYARQERARLERLAVEKAEASAALKAGNVPLKGGWPVDVSFKRLSPRSHFLLGPLPVTQ